MKKQFLFFLFSILGIPYTYATHNRAGEITYEYVSGYTYKITINTYTKESSNQADRCELTISFGDGDSATFQRNNGSTTNTNGNPSCAYYGQSLGNDVKKNIYEGYHTYAGPGTYTISVSDDNRNENIKNIPNSVYQSFYIQTVLIINPFFGGINNSPVLLNPPIDDACKGECFEHNPSAYDIDGDSLSYSLTNSYANGQPIAGYTLPPGMTSNSIDALTGDLVWCSPSSEGLYNVGILISEYKRFPGSTKRYLVGSVLRDMQINVKTCANNQPKFDPINDTCIAAGSNLNFNVTATDVNSNNKLTITSTGSPYQVSPAATFVSTPKLTPNFGTFNWSPNCDEVQSLPYLVTFKVEDDNINSLVDYETAFIRVVAPGPTNITATPSGSSITLNWTPTICNNTLGNNPLEGYLIYRKNSCDNWMHNACETGVPDYTGYTRIDSVAPSVTTFTDNENGQGLTNGVDYSYLIVAIYNDGSQSYASAPICSKLTKDVPIITNVSVLSTGTNDSIWIHWIPPVADSNNLDTLANPPLYEVRLMQAEGFTPASGSFSQIANYSYTAFWQMNDTGFVSTGINTQNTAYTYRIDFYSNGVFVGSTNNASSVFLSSSPPLAGKQVQLNWQANVPWTNYYYYIYKETSPGSLTYALLDSTTASTYTDSGLLNGISYCYKIVSKGEFSDTSIVRPLYNHSQIKCEIPVDLEPPCQPSITGITGNCETSVATVSWLNPNTYCSDDALRYKIYFAPTYDDALFLVESINDINTTTYSYTYLYNDSTPSIAGCYAVTAIDSNGNESALLVKECIDNCPVYNLPNVYTPNGDRVNDFYTPIYPYKYIKNIDMKIFNRWGTKVFETTNPDILWDGKNIENKKPCSDGVYYYICIVNEIRVDGIVPNTLKGFIHLINETKYNPE